MNIQRSIKSCDLFCGGGGWTEGLKDACDDLGIRIETHLCVNHWGPAINTHSSNHKYAKHICDKLNTIDPADVGQLHAVIASPECTHFSNARGAKPINDQKRIPAGTVPKWIEETRPLFFAIENVREFEKWGPVYVTYYPGNHEYKSAEVRKQCFSFYKKLCQIINSDGIDVLVRQRHKCFEVPNLELSSDQSYFLEFSTDEQLRSILSSIPIELGRHAERAAKEANSIIKKQCEGICFDHLVVEPITSLGYSCEWKVLNCANYGDPTTRQRLFILGRRDGSQVWWPAKTHAKGGTGGLKRWRSARECIDWSITGESIFNREALGLPPLAANTIARIEYGILKYWGEWAMPFLILLKGTTKAHLKASALNINNPVPTICAQGTHIAIAQPFLLGQHSGSQARPVDQPMMTACAKGAIGLCQPFMTIMRGQSKTRDIDAPAPTLTTGQHLGLIEGFILQNEHGGRLHELDKPMPAITANGRAFSICEPFLTIYRGKSKVRSVSEPMPTAGCRESFGLVQSVGLDIRYRMLQPKELAAAMGFPSKYLWYGNKTQIVRQIGNAVPVNTAKAILECLIRQTMMDAQE